MFEFRKNPSHAVIYKNLHSENTKIAIQTPRTKGLEGDLRKAIGGGHVDFDWNIKMYEMSSKHIEVVTAYLVERFGACELQIVTSNVELCTTQCQEATVRPVSECECICGGHNHGDGWPEGWKLAARTGSLMVKGTRKIEIFTVHKGAEGVLLREKPKAVSAPVKVERLNYSTYLDKNDPYVQHMIRTVLTEDARAEYLLQKPVGYVSEDGVEVVESNWRGVYSKDLSYPKDHDYVVYQDTLDGRYRD